MEINWADIEADMQNRVKQAIKDTETKAQSCALRAANEMRNAALNILRGQRSGKRYKMPYSNSYYTASAPGEPPAVRTGTLRMSWGEKGEGKGNGKYVASIYTDVPYAQLLDEGTPHGKISPRPYKDKVIETAKPKVIQIFSQINK